MRTLLILSIIWICILPASYGQSFLDSLRIEASVIHSKSKLDTVILDSFNNAFFASKNVKMEIDPKKNYQIMFIYEEAWAHTYGMKGAWNYKQVQAEKTIQKLTDTIPPAPLKKVYSPSNKSYSGKMLTEKLGLPHRITPPSETWLHFPAVYERDDPYNRVWTYFTDNSYLILRYVHSYPNGNTTSFYHEIVIYFKRIDS
jgi:hypothetical protein